MINIQKISILEFDRPVKETARVLLPVRVWPYDAFSHLRESGKNHILCRLILPPTWTGGFAIIPSRCRISPCLCKGGNKVNSCIFKPPIVNGALSLACPTSGYLLSDPVRAATTGCSARSATLRRAQRFTPSVPARNRPRASAYSAIQPRVCNAKATRRPRRKKKYRDSGCGKGGWGVEERSTRDKSVGSPMHFPRIFLARCPV